MMNEKEVKDGKEKAIARVVDGLRLSLIHYGIWFKEVEYQLGLQSAMELEEQTWQTVFPIIMKRLARVLGFETVPGEFRSSCTVSPRKNCRKFFQPFRPTGSLPTESGSRVWKKGTRCIPPKDATIPAGAASLRLKPFTSRSCSAFRKKAV